MSGNNHVKANRMEKEMERRSCRETRQFFLSFLMLMTLSSTIIIGRLLLLFDVLFLDGKSSNDNDGDDDDIVKLGFLLLVLLLLVFVFLLFAVVVDGDGDGVFNNDEDGILSLCWELFTLITK